MVSEKLEVMLRGADHIICNEFRTTGGVQQRGVVVLPDRMVFVPLEWDDDASKYEAISRFKLRVQAEGSDRFVMVGEAWIAPWPKRGEKLLRASASDQRQECIYTLAAKLCGENLFGVRAVEENFAYATPKRNLGPLKIEVNIDGFLPGRGVYGEI